MINEPVVTLAGNLVDDPELRFTSTGTAVANFRVAHTSRHFDKTQGEYVDGDKLFMTCTAWRQMAENIAESLRKGSRVLVSGELKQNEYETKDGQRKTSYEIVVSDIGPSLKNAIATPQKSAKTNTNQWAPAEIADAPPF